MSARPKRRRIICLGCDHSSCQELSYSLPAVYYNHDYGYSLHYFKEEDDEPRLFYEEQMWWSSIDRILNE